MSQEKKPRKPKPKKKRVFVEAEDYDDKLNFVSKCPWCRQSIDLVHSFDESMVHCTVCEYRESLFLD